MVNIHYTKTAPHSTTTVTRCYGKPRWSPGLHTTKINYRAKDKWSTKRTVVGHRCRRKVCLVCRPNTKHRHSNTCIFTINTKNLEFLKRTSEYTKGTQIGRSFCEVHFCVSYEPSLNYTHRPSILQLGPIWTHQVLNVLNARRQYRRLSCRPCGPRPGPDIPWAGCISL